MGNGKENFLGKGALVSIEKRKGEGPPGIIGRPSHEEEKRVTRLGYQSTVAGTIRRLT